MRKQKSFPFLKINRSPQPSFVIVEELEHTCQTEAERALYQKLRIMMYYPTPHYRINRFVVNIALIPYRIALIEQKKGLNEKKIIKSFNRKGWSVIFYQPHQILQEEHKYVNRIVALTEEQTPRSL
ncbi:hypothetical protein [Halalkalibacter sp. APA_J-10(15)]|nr:hypothetical protein [Halalkalibacter sp. APA_J-10(15)]